MSAVRKYPLSRVFAQMEHGTKKYPRFLNTQDVPVVDDPASWELVDDDDDDVSVIANDHRQSGDASVIRRVAAPLVPTHAAPPPPPPPPPAPASVIIAEPPVEAERSSARPTVPLGPPAVMVVGEGEGLAGIFDWLVMPPVSQGALSPWPWRSPAPAPPPLLPSVLSPRDTSWGIIGAAVGAFVFAALVIFGGSYHFRAARAAMPPPGAVADATVEASWVEPLEVAPHRIDPSAVEVPEASPPKRVAAPPSKGSSRPAPRLNRSLSPAYPRWP